MGWYMALGGPKGISDHQGMARRQHIGAHTRRRTSWYGSVPLAAAGLPAASPVSHTSRSLTTLPAPYHRPEGPMGHPPSLGFEGRASGHRKWRSLGLTSRRLPGPW